MPLLNHVYYIYRRDEEKGVSRKGWQQREGAGARRVEAPFASRGEMRFGAGRRKSLPGGGRYHPEELQSEVEPRPSTAFAGRKALSAGAFFFSRKKAGQEAFASGPGKKGSVYFAN